MKKSILILGASSAIARAISFSLAKRGHHLFLAGRELEELERIASDIKLRYLTEVQYGFFDADAFSEHETFLQQTLQKIQGIQGVVLAFGDKGNQKKGEIEFDEALQTMNRNYTGACSILTHCANYLEKEKSGFIIALSSVAGDRGRQSNYIYGSAKAGLSAFLQGLRNRLYPSGIEVLTVKPGFVDTQMTFGSPGLFLVASPQYVGEKIVNAWEKKKNELYVPWFWRLIMDIIKNIPEFLFKKLKL